MEKAEEMQGRGRGKRHQTRGCKSQTQPVPMENNPGQVVGDVGQEQADMELWGWTTGWE